MLDRDGQPHSTPLNLSDRLLTAPSPSRNPSQFLISLFTLPLAGRYLERVWGQLEFLKFVGVVVLASNIIAVVVNVLESFVLGDKALSM